MISFVDEDYKPKITPGKYGKDLLVVLILISFFFFVIGSLAYTFRGWDDAAQYLSMAIYIILLYIALERR